MVTSIFKRFRRSNKDVDSNANGTDLSTKKDDEQQEWDRPIEFVFSLISNSVGLGNVWRFPYLAANNGGGAFLIPYFILYFLIGAPLYYLELALGQFTSRGPATCFILAKGWQGIGIAMIVNTIFVMLYYNVVISWALFYFVASFRSRLLWSDCGHWWNSDKCIVPGKQGTTYTVAGVTWNCTESQFSNTSQYGCVAINTTDKVTATEEFYFKLLLNRSIGFEDFGVPRTYTAVSLLVAWIIVCLCVIRGVKTSGKIAYVTAIFPYIVLLILIIFTATLPGAKDGVKYYVVPDWNRVRDFRTWQEAASQVFFSLSIGFGALTAYASSNKFHNKFFRQMCIVVTCDCFTGVFAGFAVFATVGFLANALNESIDKYAKAAGPGLAFITYPEAVSNMPASPFFSIIFFAMLLALGLGSQFALTSVPITAIIEFFPKLKPKRPFVVVIICIASFLIGLLYTCPGGIHLLDLVIEYGANTSVLVVAVFELIAVAYIYGFNRFMNDIKMMLHKRAAEYYLFVTWCITAPILLIVIIITKFLNASNTMKSSAGSGYPEYIFPQWTIILGWIIFAVCLIPIPLVFLVNYIREYRALGRSNHSQSIININNEKKPRYLEAFTRNNSPSIRWGPKREFDQTGPYAHLRAFANDNYLVYQVRSMTLPEYSVNSNQDIDSYEDVEKSRF